MADTLFGLRIGDYLIWKGIKPESPDGSSKMIGRVMKIHENRLGKEVREKLGISIKGEPSAVIELENGVLTDLDSETDFERVEVQ